VSLRGPAASRPAAHFPLVLLRLGPETAETANKQAPRRALCRRGPNPRLGKCAHRLKQPPAARPVPLFRPAPPAPRLPPTAGAEPALPKDRQTLPLDARPPVWQPAARMSTAVKPILLHLRSVQSGRREKANSYQYQFATIGAGAVT
jgi:hypothetical protein